MRPAATQGMQHEGLVDRGTDSTSGYHREQGWCRQPTPIHLRAWCVHGATRPVPVVSACNVSCGCMAVLSECVSRACSFTPRGNGIIGTQINQSLANRPACSSRPAPCASMTLPSVSCQEMPDLMLSLPLLATAATRPGSKRSARAVDIIAIGIAIVLSAVCCQSIEHEGCAYAFKKLREWAHSVSTQCRDVAIQRKALLHVVLDYAQQRRAGNSG